MSLLEIFLKPINWLYQGLIAWFPSIAENTSPQKHIFMRLEDNYISIELRDNKNIAKDKFKLIIDDSNENLNLPTWLKNSSLPSFLAISEDIVLHKTIELPSKAAINIETLLTFEVEKQSPFSIEDVYWDYKITEKNEEKIKAVLLMVPKREIDNIILHLPKYLSPISGGNLWLNSQAYWIRINHHTQNPINLIAPCLVVILLCLLITSLYIPKYKYDNAASDLYPSLEKLKEETGYLVEIELKNKNLREQSSFFLQKIGSRITTSQLLSSLSNSLPSHTWLDKLSLNGNELSFSGHSSSVSDLIPILISTNLFSDVQFSSPTVRNKKARKDRFHINAVLKTNNHG